MKKKGRLYLDESGDHTYGELKDPGRRYLGLTGIIVWERDIPSLASEMEGLKRKHFGHDPDEPLIFHRSDIINRRGLFSRLRDPNVETGFNADLLALFDGFPYKLITVVIDKKAHLARYEAAAWHPYHYCLAVIMERYCGMLNYYNAVGDILAEARGKREDNQLRAAFARIRVAGTHYRDPTFFQQAVPSSKPKIRAKEKNIAGLQFADLLAYPTKQQVLFERECIPEPESAFTKEIWRAIESKYNRRIGTGRVWGYGKIFLK